MAPLSVASDTNAALTSGNWLNRLPDSTAETITISPVVKISLANEGGAACLSSLI